MCVFVCVRALCLTVRVFVCVVDCVRVVVFVCVYGCARARAFGALVCLRACVCVCVCVCCCFDV